MKRVPALFLLGTVLALSSPGAESKLKVAASVENVKRAFGSRRHVVVDKLTARTLVENGAEIIGAASDDSVVVSAPRETAAQFASVEPASKVSAAASEKSGSYLIVLFHSDVTSEAAAQILLDSGVVQHHRPDMLPGQHLVFATAEQMMGLAHWDEIAYIYPASDDIVNGVPVRACAGPITEHGMMAQYVSTMGRGWSGETDLTYSFSTLTNKLPRELIVNVFEQVFAEWTRHLPFRFTYKSNPGGPRNLHALFARGEHGDGVPFDGRSRVLAHTYYPSGVSPEPIAGDIHVDDDEPWQNLVDPDLYSVLLHEVGHALGLGHADRPNSVMYPYYRKLTTLQPDDVAALARLYPTIPQSAEPPAKATGLRISVEAPGTTSSTSVSLTGSVSGGTGPYAISWTSGSGSGSANTTGRWTLASVPVAVGSNSITVTVIDAAGTSAAKTIAVERTQPIAASDTAGPTLKLTSPSTGVYATSGTTVKVTGTARDNSGLKEITWTSSAGYSGVAEGTANWTVNSIPLLLGDNTITIRAYDMAGNMSWRSVVVSRR